ncbi:MAG TPA: hypothetical protein VMW03_00355 [Candidatus Krumholzibacteriaceae bacterium]|nr:hypothetical protein [Candidatus Krumholzibacteriaceae bacterium]
MRPIWLNVVTVLLLLGVGATSVYLRGMSSADVTQVNSFKMDDGPYKGGKLTIVESLSSVPNEIEVSYSANTTVSVYIMTRGAYNSLTTLRAPPEEYLEKHEGVNGTLTYVTTESNKIHVVAFYSEGNFVLHERQVNARYYSEAAPGKETLWTVNGALIVATLAVSAWSLYTSIRIGAEQTKG